MTGVLIILGNSISIQSNQEFFGNIIAFIMPISFAVLILVIRKYPKVDMVPAQFIAGVTAAIKCVAEDANGNYIIESGMDPNVSTVQGMIQSFYDAPGGMNEEFNEINWSLGAEYWYDKQFALRLGYFYENPNKGNRNHMTLGLGLKYQIFNLDFSYLVPFTQRNPLENTLRFTMSFDFADIKSAAEIN